MGSKANRNSGISGFVAELLENDGLNLYEKWFEHLKQRKPTDEKVSDFEVRDEMLQEIIVLATEGNSLMFGKKDKLLIEELLNRFLRQSHLLQ
jgi:hypothetical protein